MSTNTRFIGDGDEIHVNDVASPATDPVPQSLKEVLELMTSVNRRLEDCAVECQSSVSRKQWKILNAKSVTQRPWEQSLLARTYFTDKNLDEAFQTLLGHVRTFMDNMNNFIALLRGERVTESVTPGNVIRNIDAATSTGPYRSQPNSPIVAPLDLSSLDAQSTQRTTRRSKRLAENMNSNVQQCFADLIKAKIALDTKFLGFEAVLNGSKDIPCSSTDKVSCLCQICSNVLEAVIENDKVLREIAMKPTKVRRITKANSKRLPQSPRIWKKNLDKKQTVTVSLDDISGKKH